MGFDLQMTDEQLALKETLHDFARELLRPAARPAEEARQTPLELLSRLHDIGVCAPVDEAYGGGGSLDTITYLIAAEELAWGDPGIAAQALGSGLPALVLGRAGSAELKERYLPSFAQGYVPSFLAYGERFANGDLDTLDTTVSGAKVEGIKHGVLNAEQAPFGIVVGRAEGRLAAVVIEDGREVVKLEEPLGLEAAPTAVVAFSGEGEPLPQGPELEAALLLPKLLTGALAVGCARASLEHASAYAVEREAFGRPIGAYQGISFKIADMATEVDAARLGLWRAAWLLDRGEAGPADVAAAVGQALVTALRCGDDGVQILGGHGYIKDHPVEKWFRDAVTLTVLEAPEVLGDVLVGANSLGVS